MRIRLDSTWIAGHPDYHPAVWSPCQELSWLPTRTGSWESGAGWERAGFEDGGNQAVSLQFSVARAFKARRSVADLLTKLHGRSGLHPWSGAGLIRYDREDGGSVDINLGDCVLQMNGPARVLGALTVVIPYLLHCGVIGDQPVLTDPTAPDQDDVIEYDGVYGGGGYSY